MMDVRLDWTKTTTTAVAPERKHISDAGADLRSVETLDLHPRERRLVHTGVAIALPDSSVGFITPRSGLAAQHGITIVNAPGTIDAGYRGELMACLLNTSDETFHVDAGDRIAQLVVVPFLGTSFHEVESLSDSDRGSEGFGSTGVA